MRFRFLCIPLFLCALWSQAALGDVLTVTKGKLHTLRLDRAGATAIVADPLVADIRVENPRLIFVFGRNNGETNLVVLDRRGREIVNYDLVVTSSVPRHVTIDRGPANQTNLICEDRCATIGDDAAQAAP
ncbi:MAG: pilus assembly protein N-terminal domain-containing protein, partial [Alphaproteobacteria bacterium]|nr:pilus assembly protein N-terminal domain-containing protein [Alphaproteobacteria bacterium]